MRICKSYTVAVTVVRWVGIVGYGAFGVLGAGVIPQLYPAVKWYMVAVAFLTAPVFSVSLSPSPKQPTALQATLALQGRDVASVL